MSEEDFKQVRWHVFMLVVAAVVLALDVFVWRP
jgi:hypothetical protein